MRVNLKALGCRLNEAELETWARQLHAGGHRLVEDDQDADLVVFNSCAVTHDAARKSRNLLRKAARDNPNAKLVMTGCYATLAPSEAAGLGVDLVVANQDKNRLVEIAARELDFAAMPSAATEPGESALFRLGRQRAFVKVQDGCRHRCTYCIVTVARGDERSRSIAEIVDEIRHLQDQGIQEVVLTGVHLGGYGSDLGGNLRELLEAVLARTTIARIRLGSLEPWDLPDGFSELFANARLMPHLHLPMQSGSDSVLKRMARRCRSGEFRQLADQLRAAVPDLNLTTDIIVGFPGETDTEWQDTLEFVEAVGFGQIHIFGYSPRAGTAAANLPGRVADGVRKNRIAALQEKAEAMRRRFLNRFVGRTFPVLWERPTASSNGGQSVPGYTPNYLRVAANTENGECLTNRIASARLIGVTPNGSQLTADLN